MSATIVGPDGKPRCRWSGAAPEFLGYHDSEWGLPVDNDHRLFEKLSLEGFQSGLSWRTILAKRENFRAAFHDFDFNRIARFTQRDVDRLLKDEGIVRHRGKIEAVINNARKARELVEREGSLAAFIWRYEPGGKQRAGTQTASTSAESIALSKDLKKQGWLDQPRSTPSCRRWGWSTTTSSTAQSGRRSSAHARISSDPKRQDTCAAIRCRGPARQRYPPRRRGLFPQCDDDRRA